uniref:Replication factor A C-terminal domain-containing protein n=1 Tax=Oryza glumipatula TaxID=40148 RepID=A0A0E0BEG0_9ORYZ
MVYKKLSELTTRRHTWNIKVKVMRLWDSVNSATDELLSLDMILMDEQFKNPKNIVQFAMTLKSLSCTTQRSNKSKKQLKVFLSITLILLALTHYKTVQIKTNIYQLIFNPSNVADVIGLLTRMKPIETRMTRKNTPNPRLAEIREIELLLLGGDKIRLTLWGQLARFFSEDVIGNQTVVIVTSTTVQEYIGLSLRSSSATRIYTNLHIRETWTLIDRQFSEETIPKMMEVDKSTQGTREEQMFYNRKTLKDITEMRHGNPGSQEFVYRLRLQISDHTTSTSCTIFDDVAQSMLETPVSSLLNLLDGKNDKIPNIIQQLCGKQLIFKFKLSEQNLTEGTPNYVVKRTFVPDYMLEKQYLINKAEEELMDDDVDNILKQDRETDQQQELEDSDQEIMSEDELTSSDKPPSCKQIRRRTYIIEDDSEEESNETSMIKCVDAKVRGKNAKGAHAKPTKAEIRNDNYSHEINKSVVQESIKAGKRQAKTINGIGKESSVEKRKKTCVQPDNIACNTRPQRTRKMNSKYTDSA